MILKLVGTKGRGNSGPGCRLTVNSLRVEESKVLMKIGRLGRVKPSLAPSDHSLPQQCVGSSGPQEPIDEGSEAVPVLHDKSIVKPVPAEYITDESIRKFLELPALAA